MSDMKSNRPWLTVEEIADQLGVTRGAIQGWMNEGLISYLKVNRTIRIHQDELARFIEDNTHNVK